MQGLIGELGSDPEMQKKFEDMMQELIAAGAAPSTEEAAEHIRAASDSMPVDSSTKEGRKEAENFQDTIKRTMERMQASGDKATAASTSGAASGGEEELLAQMVKELGAGGGLGGEGGEEDFNKMLLSMMSQLTNKEILYEPMKELDEKFPAWMEANSGKVEKVEMQRYREQQRLVGEIVGRFEREGYSDGDEGDREFIVERMQKVRPALSLLTVHCEADRMLRADASRRIAAPRPRGRYERRAGCTRRFGCGVSHAMINFVPETDVHTATYRNTLGRRDLLLPAKSFRLFISESFECVKPAFVPPTPR